MTQTIKVIANNYTVQINQIWIELTAEIMSNPLNELLIQNDTRSWIKRRLKSADPILLPAISESLKKTSASTILVNSIHGFLDKHYLSQSTNQVITQPYPFILYLLEYSLRSIQSLDLKVNKKAEQYKILVSACVGFLKKSEEFYNAVPFYQENKKEIKKDFDRLIMNIKLELEAEIEKLNKQYRSKQLVITLNDLEPTLVSIIKDFPLILLKFIFDSKIPADFLEDGYVDRYLLLSDSESFDSLSQRANQITKSIINNKHKIKLLRDKISAALHYEKFLKCHDRSKLEDETLTYLKRVSFKYSDTNMFIKSLPKIIYKMRSENPNNDIRNEIDLYIQTLIKLFDLYQKMLNTYRSHVAITSLCDNWGKFSKLFYLDQIKKYSDDVKKIFSDIITELNKIEKTSTLLISFIQKGKAGSWDSNIKDGIVRINAMVNSIGKDVFPKLDLINQSLTEEWIQNDVLEMREIVKELDMYNMINACLNLPQIRVPSIHATMVSNFSSDREIKVRLPRVQKAPEKFDTRIMGGDSLKTMSILALKRDLHLLEDEINTKEKLIYKLSDENSLSYKLITWQSWWPFIWCTIVGVVVHGLILLGTVIYRQLTQEQRLLNMERSQQYHIDIQNVKLQLNKLKQNLINSDVQSTQKQSLSLAKEETATSAKRLSGDDIYCKNAAILWHSSPPIVRMESTKFEKNKISNPRAGLSLTK